MSMALEYCWCEPIGESGFTMDIYQNEYLSEGSQDVSARPVFPADGTIAIASPAARQAARAAVAGLGRIVLRPAT
jgi:hypothetical protein